MGSAVANRFFGEKGLLADTVGDFGEFALIGADGREVIGLADEVKGAESFPDLFVAGVNASDLGTGSYVRAWSHEERADAPGDGRAQFHFLLMPVSEFGDEPALV